MSPLGAYSLQWNTRDVARGVYQVTFESGSSYATRKVVVVD